MIAQVEQLMSWGELGVAVLAVAGAFWLLYQMIKASERLNDQHRQEREAQAEMHRQERVEWSKREDAKTEKVTKHLEELTREVRGNRP